MDCGPPGSSVHGTFQARTLERVTTSYSRGSSWPRNQSHISWVSCAGRQILYHCTTWEGLGRRRMPHIILNTHTPQKYQGERNTHTHPRNIPELPRNLEHHKHFYVLSIRLSESLCSDNCYDERIGGFKSLCQGGVWCPPVPIFPRHVPGHRGMDTPGGALLSEH